ncbi:MAG TPA: hypothetical protein VMQ81_13090 [Acidimicrobiia bacterium]|nr:hypothetical protein [Acidimicrobiia bacterium]
MGVRDLRLRDELGRHLPPAAVVDLGRLGTMRHAPPIDAFAAIWRPENPERRATGTFTWDGEQGVARVVGHLVDLGGISFGPGDLLRSYDVLLANLDSTNYTLVGCREQIGSMYGDEVVSSACPRHGGV